MPASPSRSKNSEQTAAANRSAVAFLGGQTMDEYINANELYGGLLARRCQEVRLPTDAQLYFSKYPDMLFVIVLATPEDPDTVAVVPVLDAIVRSAPRLSMRLYSDEDDLHVLDEILENIDLLNELDELDLPQAFFFDDEWQLADQWGPRPQKTEASLDEWLERHPEYESLAESSDDDDQDAYGALLEQLTFEMRVWYNSGLDAECSLEVRALLESLQSE
jgi:hypothetical protein